MLKIRTASDGSVYPEILSRTGEVLVSKAVKNDVEAMDFFSSLAAATTEGFRSPIVRE